MRLAGAIGVGRDLTNDESRDGLLALNGVVDQLATQRLAIYQEVRTLFPLTANQQTYTIGPGGNFNVARPMYFSRASVLTQVNAPPGEPLELALEILTTQDFQTQIPVKNIPSVLPLAVYYDYGNVGGLATIWLYPVPSISDLQLILYLPTAVAQFVDLTTSVTLTPGYYDLLVFQTAVNYASEFGLDILPAVVAKAQEAMANVKRSNVRLEIMRCDRGLRSTSRGRGRYNWISDTGA